MWQIFLLLEETTWGTATSYKVKRNKEGKEDKRHHCRGTTGPKRSTCISVAILTRITVSISLCFYYSVLYGRELTIILQKYLQSLALGPGVIDSEARILTPHPFFWECFLTLVLSQSHTESSHFLKKGMYRFPNSYQSKTCFNSFIKLFEIYHALPIHKGPAKILIDGETDLFNFLRWWRCH